MADEISGEFRSFPSTRWSFIDDAGQLDCETGRRALGELVRRYLPALRAHLVLKKRLPRDVAEEMLDSFLTKKVVQGELVGHADPGRGRFRTFLLTALDRHVANEFRNAAAHKRRPTDGRIIALDEQAYRVAGGDDPADVYDVAWARQVLAQGIARMRAQCRATDRMDVWEVFDGRLLKPLLDGAEPMSYDLLMAKFGYSSPAQAANVLITGKRMFERTLREVVADYVHSDSDVEQELLDLRQILSRVGA